MTRRLSLACVLAGALILTGCDLTDPQPATDPDGSALSADAAAAIATAVGVAPGGALNDLAEVALVLQALEGRGSDGSPACQRTRTWDEDQMAWIRHVECERGNPEGPFYMLFSRTHEFRFFDGDGAPQQQPMGAAAMHVDLVDGQGVVLRPRLIHELLDVGASFQVTDLDQDLVTTNGDYHRAATDTLRTLDGQHMRTLTYDLELELIDVAGPRRIGTDVPEPPPGPGLPNLGPMHRLWAGAVSGTVQGQVSGVMTRVTPHGTRTREFERSFVITLGDGDRGTAQLRFPATGETFVIDLASGEVRGRR